MVSVENKMVVSGLALMFLFRSFLVCGLNLTLEERRLFCSFFGFSLFLRRKGSPREFSQKVKVKFLRGLLEM